MKYLLILFSAFTFGQASNQMVTFTAAQSLGFSLNAGQSAVTSNQCMTKSDALTKYELDATAMSAYANNQLVPKSTWIGTPTRYRITSGNLSGSIACQQFPYFVRNVWVQAGTGRFFSDEALTTPYNGNNYYYSLGLGVDGSYYSTVKIDNSGYVSASYNCGF